jgi:hypothetical protein
MHNHHGKQMIFYGAGGWIQQFYEQLKLFNGIEPLCFADGDTSKHGARIFLGGGG